ncbi:unnamed protein product [Rotaria sordida]|uniref:Uncharacterized protein n=1 Tax=Rotaria sordida TaxID=392033 RepID=A0A815B0W1_9BILA|nr:unnamed protein product [Rotaria sordida]
MLSTPSYRANGDDSTMPGSYEPFTGLARRNTPFPSYPSKPRTPFPQLSPSRLPGRTPFPQLSPNQLPGRTPFPQLSPNRLPERTPFPVISPNIGPPMRRRSIVPRRRQRRRRPLTPEIVLDQGGYRRRLSRGRRRVIRVSLDPCPTLGLRGPPKRVMEIERVRCHRRRRCRPVCYEYDREELVPQPTTIITNPIPNPCIQSVIMPSNNLVATNSSTCLSNLTPQMIDSLPKQTVQLPPIHLPGSCANANTELDTIKFPTEIINPLNGTLSIIQANPGINPIGTTNIQPIITAPIQSQLIHRPTTVGLPIIPPVPSVPSVSPVMSSDPGMQRFQELFQRLNMSRARPISRVPSPPIIRPTFPTISPMNNVTTGPPPISLINTADIRPYPSTNIQSINPLNIGSYRPVSTGPIIPLNNEYYHPVSTGPIIPSNITSYRPAHITPYRPSSFTPSFRANDPTYRPSSFTPSIRASNPTYRPPSIPSSSLASNPTDHPTSMPLPPLASNPTYRPPSISSSPLASNTTYRPPSIPFPSLASNPTYRPSSIPPSSSADINPYRPANITSYVNIADRSTNNPMSQSADSSATIPYTSTVSRVPLSTFDPLSSSSSGVVNNYINLESVSSTPYQSNNSMPKSILRNGTSTDTPLIVSNVLSSNDAVNKTTRFT